MKDYKEKLNWLLNHKVYGPFGNYEGLVEMFFTVKDELLTPEVKEAFFKNIKITHGKIQDKRVEYTDIINRTQTILDILETCEGETDEKVLLAKLEEMIKLYTS